jgi:hypothetical protein
VKPELKNLLLGVLLGGAGGVLGYFAFMWTARQGFYALLLPGGLVGAASGLVGRGKSAPRAIICALMALGVGVFTEWRFAPFIQDASLGYFLSHLHDLQPMTQLMIAGGGAIAYWLALGSERGKPGSSRDLDSHNREHSNRP